MNIRLKYLVMHLGKISNLIYPQYIALKISNFFHFFHSGRISARLSTFVPTILVKYPTYLKGGKYIKLGVDFRASYRFRIEAWDNYKGINYNPKIIIGDNVSFSDNCHIGAIDLIQIGNNVLFGSNVFITDHYHGKSQLSDINKCPLDRPLFSKGPVIIEDGVWVGDSVSIMPNVTIGHSCIIGANSVVTKSFPPYCMIAGCPAKIIKNLN
ncbi:MAG: DapH/DapD/GlmU-related protein [Paludibacter sp.]|nr:DapH/DapD/GlmU-related protein [Paludibacter sp.]